MFKIETVKAICDQLQATNGKKEKELILAKYKNVESFKHVLHFLLNPYIVTGISAKKINKKLNTSSIEDVDYSVVKSMHELLEYLKINNTGKDVDIALCQSCINTYDNSDIEDFIKSIITKSLRLGIDSKTVNKVYGKDFIPEYEIQQSYSIEKYPLKNGEWFSLSEKQNGNRGSYIDGKIYARSGQEFSGLEHIIKDLEFLGFHDYFIDGELKRKNTDCISDNENFRIGTGILNSDSTDKSEICFVIFDVFPANEFVNGKSKDTYKTRKTWLDNIGDEIMLQGIKNLEIVDMFYEGTDQTQIDKYLDLMVKRDKEGLILNKDTPYKCKRHSGILKVKRFYNIDLRIIGYEEGSGRLSGTLGAFVVDYKGNSVNVGSGYSDEQRHQFWSIRDELIGKIVEVKYKEESQDKTSGLYSLQFPIFVQLRLDKSEESYN